MSRQHDDGSDGKRLAALRREIAAAEARLLELRAAIQAAQSEVGRGAMHDVLVENERLLAQSRLATQDADDSRVAMEVAVKASQTDALTGLRNRGVLWDLLSHDVALARRQGTMLAVYFLDVDDFKEVNDRFGHATGDLLLQHVANVLLGTVRASDTVCRIGGDEFVVLASPIKRTEVEPVARKLEDALRKPCRLADQVFSVSVSIGYSIFPQDGDAPGDLVHKADEAMYRAKRLKAAGR